MCHFMAEILGEEGYTIDTVQDGALALDLFTQNHFDLVISDLKMPRMAGTELLRRLKEIDPECPVLLLTAFGTIESAVDAMRAGAFHYLTKPFHTDEMLIQVERAMEGVTCAKRRTSRTRGLSAHRLHNIRLSEAMQKV
jgi:DNA-binding NtrC family response regulator